MKLTAVVSKSMETDVRKEVIRRHSIVNDSICISNTYALKLSRSSMPMFALLVFPFRYKNMLALAVSSYTKITSFLFLPW